MDNLPLLKDIHLPDDVWLFPLGYGLWFVIILPILLYFIHKIAHNIRQKSKKYYALFLLSMAKDNNFNTVVKISEILRRICLYKYHEAINLFGQDWIDFLNSKSKKNIKGKTADLLVYAPYLPENKQYSQADYNKLRDYVRHWIGENL